MESLNLHTLASSLPSAAAQQKSEKELLNDFKAAALSVATLYRSSKQASQRAYDSGYAAACQDIMTVLRQGVSTSTSRPAQEGEGSTVGRAMDWIDARMEAIKAQQEEDEEGEGNSKKKNENSNPQAPPPSSSPAMTARAPPQQTQTQQHQQQQTSLRAKSSKRSLAKSAQGPRSTSPPSPQVLANVTPFTTNTKHLNTHDDRHHPTTVPFPDAPAAGAKRRHAVMMMDYNGASNMGESVPGMFGAEGVNSHAFSFSSPSAASSGTVERRRTRSTRDLKGESAAGMDVSMDEDGGPVRKRVARR